MGKQGESKKRSRKNREYTCYHMQDSDLVHENQVDDIAEAMTMRLGDTDTKVPTPKRSKERVGSSTGSSKPALDPSSLWFDNGCVKGNVTDVIQSYYVAPWKNYDEVDEATKSHWFNLFKQHYTWASTLEWQVRRGFDRYARNRLRGMFYNVTKRRMGGEKPEWVTKDVHKLMMTTPQEDYVHKKRSTRNNLNGSMKNEINPTHFQGSISTIQHAQKMVTKNQGKLPLAHDLSFQTHFKEVPGKGKVTSIKISKKIADTYEQLHHQSQSSSAEETQKSANDLFCGRNNKGCVRGLGKGAELYYATSNSGRSSGSASQFPPAILTQMEERFEAQMKERAQFYADFEARMEAERVQMQADFEARMQARMQAHRAEIERRCKEYMEQLTRQSSGMNTANGSNFPPLQSDPRDDNDGNSGAGKDLRVVL